MLFSRKNSFSKVREIRTKVTTYLGVGAINKIDDILGELKRRGISSVLCVTGGHSYKLTGAWDKVCAAAANHGMELSLYNKVTPNPTTDSVDEAAACGKAAGAGAVITIGGGSPIDCGKGAAILLANPDYTGEDVFCSRVVPDKAVPIVAINLTHGTGSEVSLCLGASDVLAAAGTRVRVVSMPCCTVFDAQDADYREAVLPSAVRTRLAVEASWPDYWRRYVGLDGDVLGIDHFGASAPGSVLAGEFGFTVDAVVARARALLA